MLIPGEKGRNYGLQEGPASGKERKSTAPKYLSKDRSKLSKLLQSLDLTWNLLFLSFVQNIPIPTLQVCGKQHLK